MDLRVLKIPACDCTVLPVIVVPGLESRRSS
jgi:hypothetical protein